jgi:hypothetical protein
MRKIAKAALLACLCAGCVNFDKPVAPEVALAPAERNFEAVWNASLAVLRDYRFTVAVQDRREGMITTSPLVGKQWFEFWRKDAATPADAMESSIQTIYKSVTVTIRPEANEPDRYVAAVKVDLARSDKPAMVVTDTSEAYGLFTMTGTRSRWLTSFGRTAEEEAEETVTGKGRKKAVDPADRLRPTEGAATTQRTPAAAWRVPIGRDEALERQMATEIAAAAARKLGRK